MERVGVLIEKLQEQFVTQADIRNMLVTAQLLQSELLMQISNSGGYESKTVAVVVPHTMGLFAYNTNNTTLDTEKELSATNMEPESKPEAQIENKAVSDVAMPDVELEAAILPSIPTNVPEPIPHFVEQDAWQKVFIKKEEEDSPWALDPMVDFPTLAHQEKVVYELNDLIADENANASLNEKLKIEKPEMASLLVDSPVKDLKKAISINDRHRFIHELFRGDETMYERSIKTINSFHIFAEAEYWIQRELKIKLGWDVSLELVKTFDQLVKRRFA